MNFRIGLVIGFWAWTESPVKKKKIKKQPIHNSRFRLDNSDKWDKGNSVLFIGFDFDAWLSKWDLNVFYNSVFQSTRSENRTVRSNQFGSILWIDLLGFMLIPTKRYSLDQSILTG